MLDRFQGEKLRAWARRFPVTEPEIDALRRWNRGRMTNDDPTMLEVFTPAERRALLRANPRRSRRFRFRAVMIGAWGSEQVIGPARSARCEAVRDVIARIAPHDRATYAIDRSDGTRSEVSERVFETGLAYYDAAIRHRDAVGVWG